MNERYLAFKEILAFVDERVDVTDATMIDSAGNVVVTGTDGITTITVTVEFKEEESNGN
jgi:hypothetical protein